MSERYSSDIEEPKEEEAIDIKRMKTEVLNKVNRKINLDN